MATDVGDMGCVDGDTVKCSTEIGEICFTTMNATNAQTYVEALLWKKSFSNGK
jgi:formylmethanofuran dehydrogenase subunit D